jgi:hypothetical protein
MLTQLLAASCRLLRRQLENGAGEAILPSAIPSGRKAGAAEAAPELVAGSEMSRIFEAAGVAITEPSLRAVEDLVAVSARRHDDHRARMAGVDAAADEEEGRRLLAEQPQPQPPAYPLLVDPLWRVPPVDGGGSHSSLLLLPLGGPPR